MVRFVHVTFRSVGEISRFVLLSSDSVCSVDICEVGLRIPANSFLSVASLRNYRNITVRIFGEEDDVYKLVRNYEENGIFCR